MMIVLRYRFYIFTHIISIVIIYHCHTSIRPFILSIQIQVHVSTHKKIHTLHAHDYYHKYAQSLKHNQI